MIKLICVGKYKDKAIKQLVDDYLGRIERFTKIELIELKEANPSFEDDKIIQWESQQILQHIDASDFVVLLDIQGKQLDSVSLSQQLTKWQQHRNIIFVIGGSMGVSSVIKQRANYRLSFSLMTFPHLLFRVMLLEQVYRSFKIMANHAYHK